ncbi:unnamed protein product [Rhodiola kirilowii]
MRDGRDPSGAEIRWRSKRAYPSRPNRSEKQASMEKLVLKDAFLTTKKTFFYNFFPTKLEEDHCRVTNRPHQVTKSVIEIREAFPPPDPANPWRIRKTLTFGEVTNGQIFLSCNEVFDHVFRIL